LNLIKNDTIKYDSYIIKEDDFLFCLEINQILNLLNKEKLIYEIVNLAYGAGMIYFHINKLENLIKIQQSCLDPIDTCLNNKSYGFTIPLGFHIQQHSHFNHEQHCILRCGIKCYDYGNYIKIKTIENDYLFGWNNNYYNDKIICNNNKNNYNKIPKDFCILT